MPAPEEHVGGMEETMASEEALEEWMANPENRHKVEQVVVSILLDRMIVVADRLGEKMDALTDQLKARNPDVRP